jgi:hypothetical protein
MKLQAPGPENATTGFEGLKLAHECLLRLGAPGLLIGGVARRAWTSSHRSSIGGRKDVDVVILVDNPDRYPNRFENGIDWWVPTEEREALRNGNACRLIYLVWAQRALAPGLYLASPTLLWTWRIEELAFFGLHRRVNETSAPRLREKPLIHEYPVAPDAALRWRFTPRDSWEIY